MSPWRYLLNNNSFYLTCLRSKLYTSNKGKVKVNYQLIIQLIKINIISYKHNFRWHLILKLIFSIKYIYSAQQYHLTELKEQRKKQTY